jgi:hypothetical protein
VDRKSDWNAWITEAAKIQIPVMFAVPLVKAGKCTVAEDLTNQYHTA